MEEKIIVTCKHNPKIIMDMEEYMSNSEGKENNTNNEEKTWEIGIIGLAEEENLTPNVDTGENEGEQETRDETDIEINDIEQVNKIYRKYVKEPKDPEVGGEDIDLEVLLVNSLRINAGKIQEITDSFLIERGY